MFEKIPRKTDEHKEGPATFGIDDPFDEGKISPDDLITDRDPNRVTTSGIPLSDGDYVERTATLQDPNTLEMPTEGFVKEGSVEEEAKSYGFTNDDIVNGRAADSNLQMESIDAPELMREDRAPQSETLQEDEGEKRVA